MGIDYPGVVNQINCEPTPLESLRYELTWRNLLRHLSTLAEQRGKDLTILDAGGGTGQLAIRLAKQGYKVWLLDFSPEMLNVAEAKARHLDSLIRDNLAFCLEKVENVGTTFPSNFFDVVVCHTLIEHVEEPQTVLAALVRVLKQEGLFSLVFSNKHVRSLYLVLREHRLEEALATLDKARFATPLFELPERSYAVEEIKEALDTVGIGVVQEYGLCVFSHYLPDKIVADSERFDLLLRLEASAGQMAPYKHIARHIHLLGTRQRPAVGGSFLQFFM